MGYPGAVAATRGSNGLTVAVRSSAAVAMVLVTVIWTVVIVLHCRPGHPRRDNVECLGAAHAPNRRALCLQSLLLVLVGGLGILEDVDEMPALQKRSG